MHVPAWLALQAQGSTGWQASGGGAEAAALAAASAAEQERQNSTLLHHLVMEQQAALGMLRRHGEALAALQRQQQQQLEHAAASLQGRPLALAQLARQQPGAARPEALGFASISSPRRSEHAGTGTAPHREGFRAQTRGFSTGTLEPPVPPGPRPEWEGTGSGEAPNLLLGHAGGNQEEQLRLLHAYLQQRGA